MAVRRRLGSFSPKTSLRLRVNKVDILKDMACLLSTCCNHQRVTCWLMSGPPWDSRIAVPTEKSIRVESETEANASLVAPWVKSHFSDPDSLEDAELSYLGDPNTLAVVDVYPIDDERASVEAFASVNASLDGFVY